MLVYVRGEIFQKMMGYCPPWFFSVHGCSSAHRAELADAFFSSAKGFWFCAFVALILSSPSSIQLGGALEDAFFFYYTQTNPPDFPSPARSSWAPVRASDALV